MTSIWISGNGDAMGELRQPRVGPEILRDKLCVAVWTDEIGFMDSMLANSQKKF